MDDSRNQEYTMKKAVEVVEVEGEGLMKLLNCQVTLFCMNYIYTGKLVGVNNDCVLLSNPFIVYETGDFKKKDWQDAQALPHDLYVRLNAIESFGIVK